MANSIPIEEPEQVNEDDSMHVIYTSDGSVDRNGRPSIKGKSGGWRVGMILLVNQALVTLALSGVGVNLVLFMTRELHQDNAQAAKNISTWTGTTCAFSLVGAFVSDSYWGRYKTCAIFQFIFFTGLVELSASAYLMLRRHHVPVGGVPNYEPPNSVESMVFYLSIYQIALGNGAYQPAATALGADQFDENDPQEAHSKITFFSYFYLANNVGTIFSNTVLAYLEDKGRWVLGFGISAGAALLGLTLFVSSAPHFRHFKPGGNPLSRVCQVVVAALRKPRVSPPPRGEALYEVDGKRNAINGGRKILHTPDFTFLDRAAVVTTKDHPIQDRAKPPNPWRVCTITQVEEVKCILRLLPIWLSSIIYSVVFTQMNSVFVEQGAAMRTSISIFHVPPASMSIFEILGVSSFVLLYRFYLRPLPSILKAKKLTELQRMGIGLVIAGTAILLAGIVESQRLKHAKGDCDGCGGSSSLSILWQIPQYYLIGASEVFMYIAQMEFFNKQAPDGLKSFGSALYLASMSLGNYVSSSLVAIVMDITSRGDRVGWISENLNQGHMDRFYFLLAALTAVDFVAFVACARQYRCIVWEDKSEIGEADDGASRQTEI